MNSIATLVTVFPAVTKAERVIPVAVPILAAFERNWISTKPLLLLSGIPDFERDIKPTPATVRTLVLTALSVPVLTIQSDTTMRLPEVVGDAKNAGPQVTVMRPTRGPTTVAAPCADWTIVGIYAYGIVTITPTFKVCTSAAEVTENSTSDAAGRAAAVIVRFSFLIAPVSVTEAKVEVSAG